MKHGQTSTRTRGEETIPIFHSYGFPGFAMSCEDQGQPEEVGLLSDTVNEVMLLTFCDLSTAI